MLEAEAASDPQDATSVKRYSRRRAVTSASVPGQTADSTLLGGVVHEQPFLTERSEGCNLRGYADLRSFT